MRGEWAQAATLWAEIGCPYEAALALADADDDDALRGALAELQRFGARPARRSSLADYASAVLAPCRADRAPRRERTLRTSQRASSRCSRSSRKGCATLRSPSASSSRRRRRQSCLGDPAQAQRAYARPRSAEAFGSRSPAKISSGSLQSRSSPDAPQTSARTLDEGFRLEPWRPQPASEEPQIAPRQGGDRAHLDLQHSQADQAIVLPCVLAAALMAPAAACAMQGLPRRRRRPRLALISRPPTPATWPSPWRPCRISRPPTRRTWASLWPPAGPGACQPDRRRAAAGAHHTRRPRFARGIFQSPASSTLPDLAPANPSDVARPATTLPDLAPANPTQITPEAIPAPATLPDLAPANPMPLAPDGQTAGDDASTSAMPASAWPSWPCLCPAACRRGLLRRPPAPPRRFPLLEHPPRRRAARPACALPMDGSSSCPGRLDCTRVC